MVNLPITLTCMLMRLAKVAAVLLVLCAVAIVVAVVIGSTQLKRLQGTIRPLAEQELRTQLGRDVRIGAVNIHGLNQIVFTNLAIADGKTFAAGTAATAKSASADVDLLSLVLHRGRQPMDAIDCITVTTPDLRISRAADGHWNIQDILDRLRAKPTSPNGLHAQVVVADGRVTLNDAQGLGMQNTPMTQRLVGIRGTLASRGGQNYAFLVSARDASSRLGAVTLTGSYSGDSGSTHVNVSVNDIVVNAVAKFLPKGLPITFENGTAALRMSALFTSLPAPNRAISTDKLTAEVDLSGVGLRLQEMSSPIMATSGRLRLVHDLKRYPQGSQLDFINVRAQAGNIPLTLAGKLTDLNLFDLAHAQPQVDLTLTAAGQGPQFQHLFPETKWLQKITLAGNTTLVAEATGKSTDLRIDGTLNNDRAVIRGLELDNAGTTFRLSPGVATAGTRPSLTLSARVRRAVLGESAYKNLQLSLTSTTPWDALSKNPLLHGSASVGQASMPWATANNIQGKVTVTRAGVQFDEIRAGLFGGEVTAGPMIVPLENAPGEIALSASGNYRNIDLALLTKALNLKNLTGTGSGTISLTLDTDEHLHVATNLDATGVIYQGKHVNDVTATLQVSAHNGAVTIDIPKADARTEYGHFTIADGSYHRDAGQSGSGALNLPVRGDQVNLQKFYTKLLGAAQLTGTVQGNISTPVLTAHAVAENGSLLGRDFTHAESDLTYSAKELRLRNITFARDGMTGRVVDNGTGLDPRQSLVGLVATVDLHGASVDNITSLFGATSPWQIDGGAVGTVDVRYTDHGLVLGGKADISNAVVHVPSNGDYPLALNRLGLTFTYTDRMMQIQDLAVERGATILHSHGTAASPIGGPLRADMDFAGTAARLEDLPLKLFHISVPLTGDTEIAGALHGVLNGSGPEPMTVDVNLTAPQFAAAGLPLTNGSVDLQYRYQQNARELIVNHGTADGPFRAEGSGQFNLDQGRMTGVKLAVSDIDLSRLSALMSKSDLPVAITLPAGSSGQGQVNLTASGSFTKPNVTLGFNFGKLAYGKAPLPDLRGQLRGEVVDGRYRMHIDELAAIQNGVTLAQVTGSLDLGKSVDLQLSANNLTAKLLKPWAPNLPFDGKMDFSGTVQGAWQHPALAGDLQLAGLRYAGRTIPQVSGHIRLDGSQLALSKGQIQLLANGQPMQVSGQMPVRWQNFQPSFPKDRPLSLNIDLPQQSLAALQPLLPAQVKSLSGSVAGGLHVTGTAAQPRFNDGWVEVHGGNAGFNLGIPGIADSLQNIDLRAAIAGDPRQSTVTIEHLTADVGSGSLAAVGSVGIMRENLSNPQHWQWDLYASVNKLPLPASLLVAPNASGALHLISDGSMPVVKGVVLLDHMKLKEPKITTGNGAWGPFAFDPRLDIAVLVGDGVKMSKSIFSVPLQRTPLPTPGIILQQGAEPLPALSLVSYDDMMQQAGSAGEMKGTWGSVTGTLSDPRVYVRFEVDKGALGFPLNLIGSVRNARGHVTYSQADGPKIVMGIPDLPAAPAKTSSAPTAPAPALSLH